MDETETKGLVEERSAEARCDDEWLQLTVDEVVEEYVGSFGFSQLLQVFFVSLAWMFDSQSTLMTVFTDAQPEYPLRIWPESGGSGSHVVSVCGLKKGYWEHIGSDTSSTVSEWGLVCDRRFLDALPTSLYFIGSLIGSVVFGRLADECLGRKRSLLLSCILISATTYFTSLSPNIWIYALLRFANGFSRSGIGICCLVLATEATGRKWHGQVGQFGFFFFSLGAVSIPLIAYPTRENWRNLYKIVSFLPLVYSICILVPFVLESPRWLLVRGRSEEAIDVLRRHARMNGKELPLHLSLLEPSSCTEREDNSNKRGNTASPVMKLWKTKWVVRRMAMVIIAGFVIGFVYYGIQLNAENLNFDFYFTAATNAMMEIPAVFMGSVLLGSTNRRTLLFGSAFLAGISCFLCIIFSSTKENNENGKTREESRSLPQLMVEALGFTAVSAEFDVLYVFCVELFPTNVRSFAVRVLRQGLMLGASVSPLMVVFGRQNPSLSFFVFGVLSIISGLLGLWLPETRNSPVYETLEQQEEAERFDLVCGDLGIKKCRAQV